MTHGLPVRGSRSMLLETLAPLAGLQVADIGCGDGTWTRLLSEAGARVVGLDPNDRQLEAARCAPPVAGETYVKAGAEALPLADASQDVALFFNALHHVPADLMAAALAEAARVTRAGGMVVAFEPVARGTNFALNQPVDDETEIRTLAHRRLHEAADGHLPLALDREFEYVTVSKKRDYAAWKEGQVRISPSRAARFAADEAGLRAHFDRMLADLPRDDGGNALLDQPMRATVLRRT